MVERECSELVVSSSIQIVFIYFISSKYDIIFLIFLLVIRNKIHQYIDIVFKCLFCGLNLQLCGPIGVVYYFGIVMLALDILQSA